MGCQACQQGSTVAPPPDRIRSWERLRRADVSEISPLEAVFLEVGRIWAEMSGFQILRFTEGRPLRSSPAPPHRAGLRRIAKISAAPGLKYHARSLIHRTARSFTAPSPDTPHRRLRCGVS